MQRDFTNRGLGIRVFDNECVVIEEKGGVHGWVEDGQRHSLPVPDSFDSITTTLQADWGSHSAIGRWKTQPASCARC